MKQSGKYEFAKFLLDETPAFDAEILKDIRLEDSWIGRVTYGEGDRLYFGWVDTIDAVRSLSEGLAFKAGTRYERDNKIFPEFNFTDV